MIAPLPTIILVHGAWHTPPNYQGYIDALQARGFTVHTPRLPSCSNASPPRASFPDDVAHVRSIMEPLVEAGNRILMVMHSYGGAVGSEAVNGLTLPERQSAGKTGGVIHLLYLCAYALQPGTTAVDIVREAGFLDLWPQVVDDFEDGSTFPKDPTSLFLNGVEDKKTIDEALKNLVRIPMSAFQVPSTGTPWKRVPVTYAMTQRDYALPRQYQDIMLERLWKEGIQPRVVDYDANHSLFIEKKEELVQLAVEVAGDERNLV